MNAHVPDTFLTLSSALTGFTEETLIFAQQTADFYAVFEGAYGADTLAQLMQSFQSAVGEGNSPQQAAAHILDETQDKTLAEAARALIVFWYLGQIKSTADPTVLHIPSANFFKQGLTWRAIQAHPPAASTQQFGYWTTPPAALSDFL
ncbi:hypothetical protein [Shimia sagamensis]|uniref:Membrane bound FAD containing D-sorbitol dehydrogenase n=1 Tax=Shimia sagamensis TaxID=1566352 RepID=A0ABY1PIH1_9RHOB|nr:hypothetical protein [Shimia sagamensis]SMP34341.1 hypothetical protein SAMN06265373_11010 [Shimia sagamensis]